MMKDNIIDLLERDNPQFHLKSFTQEVPNAEKFFFNKGTTETQNLPRTSYAIDKDVLNYLSCLVQPNFITLETGGGYSTVVFATHAKKHICINPDITANQLIREWLQNQGYSYANLDFIEESSDRGLAKLILSEPINIALIDGSHSFPIPIIDWHFIDLFLKAGSKLIIDDNQINSVKILSEFLLLEPSYKKIEQIGRCLVFEKIKDARNMGWPNQEINQKSLKVFSEQKAIKFPNFLKAFLRKIS